LFTLVFIKTLKNIARLIRKPVKWFLILNGILFFSIIVLSFTEIPFWMYYNLSITDDAPTEKPKYIVIMSGGGIPSQSGLMRTYHAAELANKLNNIKVIITMPGDTIKSTSPSVLMRNELMLRGVEKNRIFFENKGTNTRSQALEVKKLLKGNPSIVIVTSPYHVYRTLKTFHKIGLTNTSGHPAFSQHLDVSFSFDDEELGGNNMIPKIGENTQLRYQFWSHVQFQVIVYREYFAIAFYKLKGWI
jgi:uncharacterized SAM-binding protein YcdF (DUF218 family)